MGKRCECAWLVEAVERDARLMALPLAARMLWMLLVRRMVGIGAVGLRFGSVVPNLAEIALSVSVSQTDLETHLEPLVARGMLRWAEDGALECPLLVGRASRAETARINGLKGGRPRKDGLPPAQRSMALPIRGGRAGAATETQETQDAGLGSVAKLSFSEEAEAKQASPRVVTQDEVLRVGGLAAEAAGLDPARGVWTVGVVREWLAAGADEGLILGVIGGIMGRPNPPVARGLGYFGKAVLEAVAMRPAAVPVPEGAAREGAEAYLARWDAWERGGRMGPAPVRGLAA